MSDRITERQIKSVRSIDDHETICTACGGGGVKVYPSTSAWMGGIGGMAITRSVCDRCWGSGTPDHKWTDLRKITNEMRHLRAIKAQAIIDTREHVICNSYLGERTAMMDLLGMDERGEIKEGE